jgi:uncharacterized protein
MDFNKTFHRGIASGDAFCNRTDELDRLLKNIYKTTHTLLISPRRYGKTSLALRAIEHSELPYAYIDLFMKCDIETANQEFFNGISQLVSQIIKPTELAVKKLESLLKNLVISVRLGKVGFEFNLAPKSPDKQNLKTLLIGIDELLAAHKKRAIIFIDEMQEISDTLIADEIESSLRFVAQKTQHISFIFSGSNRHLLNKIFEDRSRPLYKLCHTMAVKRISASHYKTFINKYAKQSWHKPLSDETMEEIFYCTKLHPYYMNILCGYLFEQIKLPNEEDVTKCWHTICLEEQGSIAKEIEFLTPKQKHLLQEIAKHPGLSEPTAKDFVRKVNLTPKGITGALQILLKHDLIERSEAQEFRLVDPVLEYWSK